MLSFSTPVPLFSKTPLPVQMLGSAVARAAAVPLVRCRVATFHMPSYTAVCTASAFQCIFATFFTAFA